MADWIDGFPGYIAVCDTEGRILEMNKRIADYFAESGGKALIGSNLYDCHNPASGQMIHELMKSQRAEVYTHEEDGVRELVLHVPWYKDDNFAGLVEITLPFEGEVEIR